MWVTAINIIFERIAADMLATTTDITFIIGSPNVLHVTRLHRFEPKAGNGQLRVVNESKHHVSTAHATTRHRYRNRPNKNITSHEKEFRVKTMDLPTACIHHSGIR